VPAREGFTAADDTLPKRLSSPPFWGPAAAGPLPQEDIEKAKRTYYGMLNWDLETGTPTRGALERLRIGWVADELEKHGKLPH